MENNEKQRPPRRWGHRRLKYGEPTEMLCLRLPISTAKRAREVADELNISVCDLIHRLIKKIK